MSEETKTENTKGNGDLAVVSDTFLPDNVNSFDEYVEYLVAINNGRAKGRLCDILTIHDELIDLVEYENSDKDLERGNIPWDKLSKYLTEKLSKNCR